MRLSLPPSPTDRNAAFAAAKRSDPTLARIRRGPAETDAHKNGYVGHEFLTTDRQTTLDIDSDVDQSNLISVECNLEQNNLQRERSER
eukprot:scaffold1996_cov120-Skeletonema_dohrnii-CCMP3373.AAC.13